MIQSKGIKVSDVQNGLAASRQMEEELKQSQKLICSLKKDLEEKCKCLDDIKKSFKECEALVQKLKKQIKSEQNMKSFYKNIKSQLSDALETAEAILEDEGKKEGGYHVPVQLKNEGNKNNTYSDAVRVTYMALQGEAYVAASKCSTVVKIIAKHLFDTELSQKDLPCKQSALNMSNEGNFLSRSQVVEEIRANEHFTFATDETSRQKRRYLERHIVLSNSGMMSLGFQEVASETADTLLEKSICLINELCDVYCSQNETVLRDSLFKEILSKMKCLMSDRASVMKLFDKKLANYKKEVLGTDCSTHFLFCNAHFLLGVSLTAEEVLKEISKEFANSDIKLGRDASDRFSRLANSTETPALRVVRAAADVFGPRGDEKNGCRNEWLVCLESIKIKSKFTSYRNNRFNNVFDNSSALLFHREHIIDFLTKSVSHENLKLLSILEDIKDDNIMAMVSALDKFNTLFTSPYWSLLNSKVSYGEFPPYVKLMEEFLTTKPSTSVFPDFVSPDSHPISSICHESRETFKNVYNRLHSNTLDVLKRQVSDFIGDGVFAGELDEDVKSILMTAPLSNLTGERLFGDLDYDISERRNASLHLRSSFNMWKHNGTGKWLLHKKKQEAIYLLTLERKYGPKLKKRSRDQEREVRRVIMERLRENERKKEAKEVKEREKHLSVVNAVIGLGGVCVTKDDVDRMLQEGGNRVEMLKSQIRYRKIVMQEKQLSLVGGYAQL
ncbi:uncharacterized protein LOC101863077 [Aplysia californica]|uniref:Uncharacterized protein LOC101863077 n=1 Tax=Aplysia californica TaxID=6500 RepID=A0ABM1AEJ3_APLCA|nr:uncharacterized protein LOC101863077 [Aplysia californica]XP_012946169.1 uncharacterized protein LOC101863077 [Aplysia californica]